MRTWCNASCPQMSEMSSCECFRLVLCELVQSYGKKPSLWARLKHIVKS